jgi:hypothetical protein
VNLRGDDEDTEQEDCCASVDTFATTVQDYTALDPNAATSDEIREASAAFQETLDGSCVAA